MLIPSIDLLEGRIVQLIRGEKLALEFRDFEYWIERFASYPLVQLIDLDAAMRQGDNAALVAMLSKRLPCQVGGGVRTVEKAKSLLAAGARRVIVGSSLFRPTTRGPAPASVMDLIDLDFAEQIATSVGVESLTFGVDTKGGRIAVHGWKQRLDLTAVEAIPLLDRWCHAFLYTHVDVEGTMAGFPMDVAVELRKATKKQLIVAGGIRELAEVHRLHAMGVDAVSGMAIYTGSIPA